MYAIDTNLYFLVAQVEVAVAKLLRPLAVTVCFTLLQKGNSVCSIYKSILPNSFLGLYVVYLIKQLRLCWHEFEQIKFKIYENPQVQSHICRL